MIQLTHWQYKIRIKLKRFVKQKEKKNNGILTSRKCGLKSTNSATELFEILQNLVNTLMRCH